MKVLCLLLFVCATLTLAHSHPHHHSHSRHQQDHDHQHQYQHDGHQHQHHGERADHSNPVPPFRSFDPFVLYPFLLNEVTLLPGTPAYDGQELNKEYLHFLDADSLLYNFMINAGFNSTATPLGGWEDPTSEVRGHFTAFYITASAKAFNTYGDVAQKEKADYMVAQMAKCQEALGNGYLSAFPESFFDRLEALQPVWAPYYMIHKIMQALWDMYTLTGNQQAYPMILNMVDYFVARIRNVVAEYTVFRWHNILYNEYGGMNEFMYILYNHTGNPDHLYMAQMFDMGDFLGPLAVGEDYLTTFHANQHIPIALGAAARYETMADEQSRDIFENFYGFVVYNRTYATGGHNGGNGSQDAINEHWGDPGRLSLTLTNNNQEFCTMYNILKVTMHLIQWYGDVEYFDYYERAYFNGILGTQDPAGVGIMIYNYPMGTGFSKNTSFHGWGTPLGSFWCCYATAVEQWAKMGEAIYFKSRDNTNLYVNLFVASALTWTARNIYVTQITTYPVDPVTTLTVKIPPSTTNTTFTLNVHIPYWVTPHNASITLNGHELTTPIIASSFFVISREWANGDEVVITVPFSLHLHYMNDNPNMAAVMYGPLVLGGLAEQMYTLLSDENELTEVIKPVEGIPNTFTAGMNGGANAVLMVPLYTLVNEVYGVYWWIGNSSSSSSSALSHKVSISV